MNQKKSNKQKGSMGAAYFTRLIGTISLVGAGALATIGALFIRGIGTQINTTPGIVFIGFACVFAALGNYLSYVGVVKQAIAEGLIEIPTKHDKIEDELGLEDDVEEDIQQDLEQEKLSYDNKEDTPKKRGRPKKIKEEQ